MNIIEIHKAGGILIRDRKLLVERSKGETFFIAPGGSIHEMQKESKSVPSSRTT